MEEIRSCFRVDRFISILIEIADFGLIAIQRFLVRIILLSYKDIVFVLFRANQKEKIIFQNEQSLC